MVVLECPTWRLPVNSANLPGICCGFSEAVNMVEFAPKAVNKMNGFTYIYMHLFGMCWGRKLYRYH